MILVNDQLDAQFIYSTIRSLQSSTCFEKSCAHHQEVNCINTASGKSISVGGSPVCRSSSSCIPDGHLQRLTIPDAVLIQLIS